MKKLLTITIGAVALGWLVAPGVNAQDSRKPLFDGKSLAGWEVLEGERQLWRVENGVITAGSLTEKVPHNSFLATKRSFHNFELRLKIRITGTEGFVNSGIQIRSVRMPGSHEMIGYQVDAGRGWWGKLYDESRRRKVSASLPTRTRSTAPSKRMAGTNIASAPKARAFARGSTICRP